MRMKSEKKVYMMKEVEVDDVENLSFDEVLSENGAEKSVPVSKAPAYVITGQQLLKNKVMEIPTLIEPIFPKVGVAAMAGASDTGKSSFLRQMAMAIVSGEEEFQNFKINAKHKSVIYLSTEDDELAIGFLLSTQNNGKHEDTKFSKLRYIFESDRVLEKLEEELMREPADCIFIDAFSDLYDGQMNETNKIRSFLNRFSDLAKKYQCLIIFLHHTAKRSEESAPSKNNLLGSQGFEAKMRLVIELRKDFVDPTVRHLCIVKGNYLKSEFKEKSYVLRFDEQMLFSNLAYRVDFDKLSKPSCKKEDKTEVLEKINRYKIEGNSVREMSEKLQKEGFKGVGKSAVANMLKSLPKVDDIIMEKGEEECNS
jgi:RecA-family ATPase